jgi:hypothetical protein
MALFDADNLAGRLVFNLVQLRHNRGRSGPLHGMGLVTSVKVV